MPRSRLRGRCGDRSRRPSRYRDRAASRGISSVVAWLGVPFFQEGILVWVSVKPGPARGAERTVQVMLGESFATKIYAAGRQIESAGKTKAAPWGLPFGRCSTLKLMAEREGFEPSRELAPPTRLAGECLQPLGHLSGHCRPRL